MLRSLGKALQTAENSTLLQQTSSECQKAEKETWSMGSVRPLMGGGGAVEEAEQFPRRDEELQSMGRIRASLTGQRCARSGALCV